MKKMNKIILMCIILVGIFSISSLATYDYNDYKKEINFTENSGFNIDDYPIIFSFDHEGRANSECSDIIVADVNGNPIPFAIRNCGLMENHTDIVTKTNLTANGTTTIYVSYGNTTPVNSTASIWNDIRYNFWDDFDNFNNGNEWQSKWDKMWYSLQNRTETCKAESDNTTNLTLTDGRLGLYHGNRTDGYGGRDDDCRSSFVSKQSYDMKLMNITAEGNNSENYGSGLYIAAQEGDNNTMSISLSTKDNTNFYISRTYNSVPHNYVITKFSTSSITHYIGDYHSHTYASLLVNLTNQTHGTLVAYDNTTKVVDNIIYPHINDFGEQNFDMYIGLGFEWNDDLIGWDYWDDVYAYKCYDCFNLSEPTVMIGPEQVNMIYPSIFLTIDDENNKTVEINDLYNISFWKEIDTGEIFLYEDGNLTGNITNTSVITLFDNKSVGTYNYTVYYPQTWKYFESSITRFLTVVDPLDINISPVFNSTVENSTALYTVSIQNRGTRNHEINISANTDITCYKDGLGYTCDNPDNKTENATISRFNVTNYFNLSAGETNVTYLAMEAPKGNYSFNITISDKIESDKQDSVEISLEVLPKPVELPPVITPPPTVPGNSGGGTGSSNIIIEPRVNKTINRTTIISEPSEEIEIPSNISLDEEVLGPTGLALSNTQINYLGMGLFILLLVILTVYYMNRKEKKKEFRYHYSPRKSTRNRRFL